VDLPVLLEELSGGVVKREVDEPVDHVTSYGGDSRI
jgi:hypothetical protein